MAGSIRSLLKPRSRDKVRSSSAPASRLYPTTSATRIAAIFRVSLMERPHASCKIAQEWPEPRVYLLKAIRAKEVSPSQGRDGGLRSIRPVRHATGEWALFAH